MQTHGDFSPITTGKNSPINITAVLPPAPEPKEPVGKGYHLPSRNPCFTGREESLTTIAEGFEQASTSVICQAGTGLGGVGKTTLAVEYAYRYADRYDLIAFLDAGTPTVLDTNLLGLADHLENLRQLPKVEDPKARQELLKNWLSQRSRWLLIADNADDPGALKAVQGFIPNPASGHVLITTRMGNPAGIPKANIRSVGVFTREETLAFLREKTGGDPDDPDWREYAMQLAEELGDLPLALEQAAALMTQSRLSLAEYLADYRRERLALLSEGAEYALLDEPELKQVAVTWKMNLNAVAEKKPILKDLLNLSAFMAPETIPFEWITRGLAVSEPETFGAYEESGKVKRMLTPLHDYSLVQMDGETGYRLHRLVQEVIRHPLLGEERTACHLRCMRGVSRTVPETEEYHTWDRLLYTQGLFLAQSTWSGKNADLALLCNQTGYYAQHILSKFKTAKPLLVKALKIWEDLFGEYNPDMAISYNNLGGLYEDYGNYTYAETLYEKALEIWEGLFGECNPDMAISYNNLGMLYKDKGDLERAKPLLVKALEIREGLCGERHPNTAMSYNNLGLLCQAQGDYTHAEHLYEKTLAIYACLLGEHHPNTAMSYNNLGGLYQAQRNYELAEPLLVKAFEILKELLGERHPSTATSCNNLGTLYMDKGDLKRAKPLLVKALKIRKGLFGERHPSTATSYNNLGALYQAQGYYTCAEPLYVKGFIGFWSFGPEHPITLKVEGNLRSLYQAMGLDEADIQGRLQACCKAAEASDTVM